MRVSRKAARESGALFYIGVPCYRGHEPRRYTASGHCVQCQLDKANARYPVHRLAMIERATRRFQKIKSDPAEYEKYIEARRPLLRAYKGIPEPTRPEPATCELCGRLPDGGAHRLNIDHDHDTGMFRGWLCWGCNTAIGKLGDTLDSVERAAKYMRNAYKK